MPSSIDAPHLRLSAPAKPCCPGSISPSSLVRFDYGDGSKPPSRHAIMICDGEVVIIDPPGAGCSHHSTPRGANMEPFFPASRRITGFPITATLLRRGNRSSSADGILAPVRQGAGQPGTVSVQRARSESVAASSSPPRRDASCS